MTTAAALITRTRALLLSNVVETRNKLATTINSGATSVVCSYDAGLDQGSVIEIDSELMYVWAANTASKTLTVERGWDGTTAASHTAGAVITMRPRFPRARMLTALNAELVDLSASRLFKVATVEVSYTGSTYMQEITSAASVQRVLQVQYRNANREWPDVSRFRLVRAQDTDEFTSGFAVKFDEPVPTGPVRITYAADFTQLTAETQDLTTNGGLPATCEDIVELGVQLRLMTPREVARNFNESQGDTRRPDEVGAGSIQQSWQGIARLRQQRIANEAGRLAQMYPPRMTR